MATDDQLARRMTPTPSAAEAAAIVAAVERFVRATTGPATTSAAPADPWQRAAILEGISRAPQANVPDPWINT